MLFRKPFMPQTHTVPDVGYLSATTAHTPHNSHKLPPPTHPPITTPPTHPPPTTPRTHRHNHPNPTTAPTPQQHNNPQKQQKLREKHKKQKPDKKKKEKRKKKQVVANLAWIVGAA